MTEEQRFSSALCRQLDLGLQQLPSSVTHRLSDARMAALAALPSQLGSASPASAGPASADAVPAGAGVRPRARPRSALSLPSLRRGGWLSSPWPLAYAAVPALLVIAVALPFGSDGADGHPIGSVAATGAGPADDIVAFESSLLSDEDEVPVSAYADRDFGIYMRKTQLEGDGRASAADRPPAVWR